MNAIDDGIWSANYDAADVMFLVSFIVLLAAAILYAARPNAPTLRWAPVALAAGAALIALGLLVL